MLGSQLGVCRDLRQVGRYEDALQASRELADTYAARDFPWNFIRLNVYNSLSVSLRRVGYYDEAWKVAEDTYRGYLEFAGPEPFGTLSMATNLICDRRMTEDLIGTQELSEATAEAWTRLLGRATPGGCTRANLAIVLRLRGFPDAAREMNQDTLDRYREKCPYDHPEGLVVMTNRMGAFSIRVSSRSTFCVWLSVWGNPGKYGGSLRGSRRSW